MIDQKFHYLLQHPDISFAAPTGEAIEVRDAASGVSLAWVKKHSRASVEAAILRSERAQAAFKQLSALQRADLLMAWYQLILKHQDDLAQILTAEQGKPLAEASGEIKYAASFIRWFAEQARRIDGDVIASGKSYLKHLHNGDSGGQTSPPI